MLPGVADKQNLQPFYDNLNTVIRAQDPDGLIFFESTTWDDDVPIGFEHAPGGDTFANRSVISFHYYFPPNISPENQMGSRTKDAGRLQTGLFLTEFDIGDDQDDEKVLEKMIHTMDVTDAYTVSWMGW